MSLRSNFPGTHYQDPRYLIPRSVVSSSINTYTSGGTSVTAATTAAFTGFAAMGGVQDNTDWTANTYKTIYSHTGMGVVYGMIACTAGGAETTTFEITIDGVLREITVTNANTERACLLASDLIASSESLFTTASVLNKFNGSIDSGTLTTFQTAATSILPPQYLANLGIPGLVYKISCLIRMKHSTSITNSTATSYSAVFVRKGIAA